ncbi:hypothetical protein Rhe02_02800 [Rhizocola hellebori]|uniref:Uncharacterized protein n=1 Tax=Rhizocola hellebori TaxID=1392758 RepID=A0A8J3Q2F2_9ACTN|nr:hypothetical protein Rhe02_02800 [Rhizocola hellebori]
MIAAAVLVRLSWWPSARPLSGRLVLQRTVTPDDRADLRVCELWLSEPWEELDLLALASTYSPLEWIRLVQGLPVYEIQGPVSLVELERDDLAELESYLAEPPGQLGLRQLAELRIRTRASEEKRVVTTARLLRAETDVLSHIFDIPFRETLNRLRLSALDKPQAAEPAEESLGRIRLDDVRQARLGEHLLALTTFTAHARQSGLNFDDLLRRPRVLQAVRNLQCHPADTNLVDVLLDELADPDWAIEAHLVGVDVHALRSTGFYELLSTGLFFSVNDSPSGDNKFVYAICALPAGSDLLRENPKLAQALAGHLCPRLALEPDVVQARASLDEVLAAVPVSWKDGRIRNLSMFPAGEGEVLRIRRADGTSGFQAVSVSTRVRSHPLPQPDDTGVVAPIRPAEHDYAEAARIVHEGERAQALANLARAEAAWRKHEAARAQGRADVAAEIARRATVEAERASAKALAAQDEAATLDTQAARDRADRAESLSGKRRDAADRAAAQAAESAMKANLVDAEAKEAQEKARLLAETANRLRAEAEERAFLRFTNQQPK